MARKLRIAFLAACGILCLLLIALWVRSYSRYDNLTAGKYGLSSFEGELHADSVVVLSLTDWMNMRRRSVFGTAITYSTSSNATVGDRGTAIPFWLIVLVMIIVAAVPWGPWTARFSLRTLLLAVTLIAALLGIAVWATQ